MIVDDNKYHIMLVNSNDHNKVYKLTEGHYIETYGHLKYNNIKPSPTVNTTSPGAI